MKIRNLTKSWMEISDISVRIPPSGKGEAVIQDDKAASSKDLGRMLSSGLVEISESGIRTIVPFDKDGEQLYMVPSTDLWSSSGNAHKAPHVSGNIDRVSNVMTGSSDSCQAVEKRFVIERAVDSSVTIDGAGAGIVLNKFINRARLQASAYFSDAVQRAVSSKVVRLIAVEELVDGEWTEMKFDQTNPSAVLASDGECCVFWEGPIFDGGGYANMNRQYIFNLDSLGVRVKPSTISTLMDVEKPVKEKIMAMSGNMIPLRSPKVYATNVPGKHYGRVVAYTMMETEGRIHPLLVHKLVSADEIWVPCEWNRRVFMDSGVRQDIHVMPLGVDTDTYTPGKRKVYFSRGTKGFVFLSVFNWNWRKGPDVMLKAYCRAFTSKDDVSMIMVSRFVGQKSMSDRIFRDVKDYVSRENNTDLPHLALVDDVIPTFMMPMLYNSASACIQISRGEGFGLPACEAVASGVPLLASDHGGHRMFLDADIATLVTPDQVRRVDKSIEWISPFYHGMEFVDYSDKAIDDAAEKMRWMYNNRDTISVMADAARRRIVSGFSWRTCAGRVKTRLEEIQP